MLLGLSKKLASMTYFQIQSLYSIATRPPVQRRPPTHQIPQGFFDGVPPDPSHYSSERPGSTFLGRLFHRNRSPSGAHATSPSSPLDWARRLVKQRGRSGEVTELQGRSPAIEVPYAKGKRVCSLSLSLSLSLSDVH
ncbi:hypothetical protein C8R48DRAFT_324900 [Suillus tomentosus]|nr:hypothetical protein C8R48DRAFT_324900 [Suillus tomentosus]